jgi:hypothetical protein
MEKSKSGEPIYRYDEKKQEKFEAASGNSSIDEITGHIEKYIGKVEMVFHEIVSDKVHIDIHWVKPTTDKPYHTLITSGMSDKPMNTPEELEGGKYAELCICLPEEWKISDEDFEDENNYWPVRWLKFLARFPHDYNTWLGWGHTIPNGDPPESFIESTKLTTMILLPPIMFGEEFQQLELEEKIITFFSLVPLYTEELNLKLEKGAESLFNGFDEYGVTDILDINRPCIVKS